VSPTVGADGFATFVDLAGDSLIDLTISVVQFFKAKQITKFPEPPGAPDV
jgi:hypothetical protein